MCPVAGSGVAEHPVGAALGSCCCCCAAAEGLQRTPWHCPQLGLGRTQEGSAPESPEPPSKLSTPGLGPRVIRENKAEGMWGRLRWADDALRFAARRGKRSSPLAFAKHQPRVGSVLWKCLWPFPKWLGSAQRGHKSEPNTEEKVRSGPGAQQPHRGKTRLLQPNRGVGSKVWS